MTIKGTGAAPGIALGRVQIYIKNKIQPARAFVPAGEEQSHLDRYQFVKNQALNELEEVRLSVGKLDPEKAEIFAAHKDIVNDIVINEEIPAKILNDLWTGDWAIYHVYETFLSVMRQTPSPSLAERAADIEDVRNRLLKIWYGQNSTDLGALTEPVIIAAKELLPSDTAAMNRDKVLAILTETGGITSHSAIIARSYGIPAVLGIQGLLERVTQGQLAAVNAASGIVILDPDSAARQEYALLYSAFQKEREAALTFLDKECQTADKIKIDIGLNISTAAENEFEAAAYADSVGLFRSEFLYLGRDTLPSEEEQFFQYKKVLECFGKRAVILRTLDVGADKMLSAVTQVREDNPFLGNRGIRFCFNNPSVFKTQVRACLRASVYGNLWLMFPMIGSIDDIKKAKAYVNSVKEELKNEGKETASVKIGIMIEIPSIALIADHAAKEADFASIGSNDLCQYICAADRLNSEVGHYYQQYHPAMIKMIRETVKAFDNAGKPISICGEIAGDTKALPLLIGLGLRKFSMGAASIADIKRVISSVTVKDCKIIAEKALGLCSAGEVKTFLNI